MTKYFKRPWEDSRGDEFDSWGPSVWYFEIAPDRYPMRQIEVYADGTILKYDKQHADDQFGGLGVQQLDVEDFEPFEISSSEFDAAWSNTNARNR